MRVVLKCATTINKIKVSEKTEVEKVEVATCLLLPEAEARALINRQHARVAAKNEKVNFSLTAKKTAK